MTASDKILIGAVICFVIFIAILNMRQSDKAATNVSQPRTVTLKGEVSPKDTETALKGLTPEQVVQLLGRPDDVNGPEIWHYRIYKTVLAPNYPDQLRRGFLIHDPTTDFYFDSFTIFFVNGVVVRTEVGGETMPGKIFRGK